ncbi:MAG: hypothetical protein C7M88_06035 [Candidatus Arcticimaribacter sp.]|nr:MAG: hypothetical protein C7M88_06035 [Candidatus Arcticimaribacter sp.]
MISIQFAFSESLDLTMGIVSQEWCHIECPTIGGCIEMGSLDLTMGSDNLAGMSVRVFAFRKCIENDIHTRSDHG